MGMRAYRLALAAAVLSIAGCSGSTEPVGYTLPDPDPSLDPAAVVRPTVLYACGYWNGDVPADSTLFIDIAFNRKETDPVDRPLSASIAAVERRGGQIVYRFHFPVVRAWMQSNAIPALFRDGGVNAVYRVTNPRRYDWGTFVAYVKPNSYADGTGPFEQLGGRVDSRYNSINSIFGVIPGASVSTLRRDGNVKFVEGGSVGCTD
jgi:hypothetical protein